MLIRLWRLLLDIPTILAGALRLLGTVGLVLE
jgi:hypothetical protein